MTKQAVLELQDAEVTAATVYLVIKTNSISMGRAIDLLKSATDVAIVPTLPEDTEPWTRLVLTFGGAGGDPFAGYLRITAPTETVFISLRGTVTQESKEWFPAGDQKTAEGAGHPCRQRSQKSATTVTALLPYRSLTRSPRKMLSIPKWCSQRRSRSPLPTDGPLSAEHCIRHHINRVVN